MKCKDYVRAKPHKQAEAIAAFDRGRGYLHTDRRELIYCGAKVTSGG